MTDTRIESSPEEARQVKTKKRVIGKQFGPEPHQSDPFEGITDREFEAEVLKAF